MAGHAGHVHGPTSGKRLWVSLGITLLFCAGEALAGWVSHSLALLSDAGHNLSDALALGLAAYAISAVRKPAAGQHTYGHHRVATLTALFNASTLVAIALYIGFEAFWRFRNPEPIGGSLMIGVALISVVMNTVIAMALAGDAKHSLNTRAAYIHMAGDALSGVGVAIAGLVIRYTGWPYADPVVSILIGIFILWSAIGIVRETMDVLMEKAPRGLDLQAVAKTISEIDPVRGLHDLHVWMVGEGHTLLSCHIALPEGSSLEMSCETIASVEKTLHDKYGIEHATIQAEVEGLCRATQRGSLYCKMEPHNHTHHHDHGAVSVP